MQMSFSYENPHFSTDFFQGCIKLSFPPPGRGGKKSKPNNGLYIYLYIPLGKKSKSGVGKKSKSDSTLYIPGGGGSLVLDALSTSFKVAN